MKRYHKRLLHVGYVFGLLFLLNATEYFLLKGRDMKVVKGIVSNVDAYSYFVGARSSRPTYYTRTTIRLGGGSKGYYTSESGERDSLLLRLQEGDAVEIYTRRFYHYLTFVETGSNMFRVKKDGAVIYDISEKCMESAKIIMIVSGIIALLIFVIYLDVAKHISLENWFQKRILKNPDYINGKKDKAEAEDEEKFFID